MIPFNVLTPLDDSLATQVDEALKRVLKRGWYVLGPEVEAFEAAFANWHGVPHAVAVASGTDAIELALRAAGIGHGDEVITVSHTAIATVCAIERAGALPVFVDVDEDGCTMDPGAALAAITSRTRAMVPVHLYGRPAHMDALMKIARQHSLLIIEDCAQAHGARWAGELVGTVGTMGAFSFYPTKNLGAYGDGGAVITRDRSLAERLRRLRFYGQETAYHAVERGINSRLDELQAAVLTVKLAHLHDHIQQRRAMAAHYRGILHGVRLPADDHLSSGQWQHAYHLFVVRHGRRDWLREALLQRGVKTQVHYPVPVHLQPAYADLDYKEGSLPVTERLAREVLSLPFFIGLKSEQIEETATTINGLCAQEVGHAD